MLNSNNQVQVFNFENYDIRIKDTNGEIWFVLVDVCKILEIGNSSDVKKRLKEDGVDSIEVIDSMGRLQCVTIINQRNFDKCILRSRTAKAEQFQDWIVDEILPQIRKTGSYQLPMTEREKTLAIAKDYIKAIEEVKQLTIESQQKDNTINEYIQTDSSKTYTEVAKILHLKPHGFIGKLRILGFIDKKNMPYQQHINSNWFEIKKSIKEINQKTKHYERYLITQKGFKYFSNKVSQGLFNELKVS